MRKGKKYKLSVPDSSLHDEIEESIRENINKFKDPVVLGQLVFMLLEERESTNRILKNLLARIEELERKISAPSPQIESGNNHDTSNPIEMLSPIDRKIYNKVVEMKKASAKEIQEVFGYKGRNAASSRLNKLYAKGLLRKMQIGKTVYFFPKNS